MKATFSLLFFSIGGLLACEPPMPSECDYETSYPCDLGGGPDGCWLGDFCQPLELECPVACYPPPMSECAVTEAVCDMGMDMNGCWMGDYCMPEGESCPDMTMTGTGTGMTGTGTWTECPEMTAAICDETSHNCDMGGDAFGCWMGDFCQPLDMECPVACWSPPMSMCGATDIVCDMGVDKDGCWLGDYCMPAGETCPTY